MLSRMYTRWAESRGWEVEVTDALPGEGAGLKSVTMLMKGENQTSMRDGRRPRPFANGWLRAGCPTKRMQVVLKMMRNNVWTKLSPLINETAFIH